MTNHLSSLQQTWRELENYVHGEKQLLLDGETLTISAVVAAARHATKSSVLETEAIKQRLQDSVNTLATHLERGEQVYGVTTGCGGNADTRTKSLQILQHSFLQHQQSGIIPGIEDMNPNRLGIMEVNNKNLPEDVVRGTMLLRCNSLLRGHSAVRLEVFDTLLQAMNHGLTPLIPLRGSISASGDLSPLSYVAGLIEGNPGIYVRMNSQDGNSCILTADKALYEVKITPKQLNAKEGLGLMNGTAVSAAAAALVLYDSHNLAVLTQVLTAMATEALLGSVDNYHEFISQCRPHPGQKEVAQNMRAFLIGSALCPKTDNYKSGLVQDRYSLRTAPQWIGPQLEDLLAADQQIAVELNSTTDNPLIDVAGDKFYHGGNFQAASVTSAMEKSRSALMMLGRILLAQSGELVNPALSKGLPPNLCSDDPSISFAVKGLDINMTAYFSEMAYLANSVASHVQTAELNNQSVNSLALISARYTGETVQLLSMMCSAHLYILCQALDLRALTDDFFKAVKQKAELLHTGIFSTVNSLEMQIEFESVWSQIENSWSETTRLDLSVRCKEVAAQSFGAILHAKEELATAFCKATKKWENDLSDLLFHVYEDTRSGFTHSPSTASYLGNASKAMYLFVRNDLAIPFHRGVVDHPAMPNNGESTAGKHTIGTYVSRIYVAVREGKIVNPISSLLSSDS